MGNRSQGITVNVGGQSRTNQYREGGPSLSKSRATGGCGGSSSPRAWAAAAFRAVCPGHPVCPWFLIHIDAQDIQDLAFGACGALFPGIHHPVPDHRQSQLPLQLRPILLILCILCIDV